MPIYAIIELDNGSTTAGTVVDVIGSTGVPNYSPFIYYDIALYPNTEVGWLYDSSLTNVLREPPPDNFSIWNDTSGQYAFDPSKLTEAREYMIDRIKEIRSSHYSGGVVYGANTFQTGSIPDSPDTYQSNYFNALTLLRETPPQLSSPVSFPDEDNVEVSLTDTQIAELCGRVAAMCGAVEVKYKALRSTINSSTTPLDENITTGWPSIPYPAS